MPVEGIIIGVVGIILLILVSILEIYRERKGKK